MPSKLIKICCPYCNNFYDRRESDIKDAINKSGKWVCQTCTLVKRNKSRSRLLGATREDAKRIKVKTENGWELEHRVIMGNILGRKISRIEAVHHINKNRKDNRPENLMLMLHSDHTKFHHQGSKRSKITCRNISIAKINNNKRRKIND